MDEPDYQYLEDVDEWATGATDDMFAAISRDIQNEIDAGILKDLLTMADANIPRRLT